MIGSLIDNIPNKETENKSLQNQQIDSETARIEEMDLDIERYRKFIKRYVGRVQLKLFTN